MIIVQLELEMAIGTNNKFSTIDVELDLRNKKIYIGFQINVQALI